VSKLPVFLFQAPLWGISPPIGLAQLGAYLASKGRKVRAFDMNLDLFLRRTEGQRYAFEAGFSSHWTRSDWAREFLGEHEGYLSSAYLSELREAGPCVAGFSINATSLAASLATAARIREACPDVKLVFGGQHFTLAPEAAEAAIQTGNVDAVVLGDGEEALEELCALWESGSGIESCEGLWIPAGDGAAFTGKREPVDLDSLPFADFGLFDLDKYENYDKGRVLLATSRGCIRACAFCGYRVSTPGYRTMSAARIHAEILHQRKLRPDASGIYFYDLVVNGDMEVLDELCDRLIAGPDPVLPWDYCHLLIRPELSAEFCRKLRRAGCFNAQIGLESGSQPVLDRMRKGQRVEDMEAVLKNLHGAGITVKANFMFGFPGETEAHARETLDFLRRTAPHLPKVYPSYTFTLLEPFSPLNKRRERFGVVKPDGAEGDVFWESEDGSNTYPVRFERYKAFCCLAEELGIEVEYGYKMPIEAFQAHWLSRYFEHKKDPRKALEQYDLYLRHDPENAQMRRAREECAGRLKTG